MHFRKGGNIFRGSSKNFQPCKILIAMFIGGKCAKSQVLARSPTFDKIQKKRVIENEKTIRNKITHGLLNIWTELLSIFLADLPTWGGNLGPKLHPGGGLLGPWFFIILKNSHQDLSNDGSNFILSSLEVGHWGAQ